MTLATFWWLPLISVACSSQIVIQIASVRMFPSRGLYPSILAGFIGGLAALLVLTGIWLHRPIAQHVANFGIYLCFSYAYFHWNNMGETARRIRLVIEIFDHNTGLTRPEILSRYNSREVIDRRIHRLLKSGQIRTDGTRMSLWNPSVLLMSTVIAWLKWILRESEL